ncbi:MAG: hypothetical protein V1849_03395 [Chloroflexota bacterium]
MKSGNSTHPTRLFYGYIVILASFILMVVSHGTARQCSVSGFLDTAPAAFDISHFGMID